MIKIPITYENFDGQTVTEEHYFHLSKAELLDMLGQSDGEDIVTKLERVGKSNDGALIMKTFKEIIGSAYGQRVDGSGSEFYKDPDLTKRFLGSLAFDQLLTDLLTNSVSAGAFVNGLLPRGLDKLASAAAANSVQEVPLPGHDLGNAGPWALEATGLKTPLDGDGKPLPWAFRDPTQKELTSMRHDQLLEVMQRKNSGWKPPVSA